MDLNIAGKSAIVCGSSRGLGKACALALASEGVNVWLNARHRGALDDAASEIASCASGSTSRAGRTMPLRPDRKTIGAQRTPPVRLLVCGCRADGRFELIRFGPVFSQFECRGPMIVCPHEIGLNCIACWQEFL